MTETIHGACGPDLTAGTPATGDSCCRSAAAIAERLDGPRPMALARRM